MSDLADDLRASWRWLDSEWAMAHRGWRDDSAREFENDCWAVLRDEEATIVESAEALLAVLDAAARVARG
jgi:hypothetical protein